MSGGYGSFGGLPPFGSAGPGFAAGPPPLGLRPPSAGPGGRGYGGNGSMGTLFLQQGPPRDRLPSEHSILRSGGNGSNGKVGLVTYRGSGMGQVNMWELIFVPWVFLVLVLVTALQAGTFGYFRMLIVVPVVLLPLNLWFIRNNYAKGRNIEVVLGILCMTSIVISLAVAGYGVLGSLVEYNSLSQGASYFNVLPTEAAGGKNDATTLKFTNATLVDVTRTFGFIDTRDKARTTYCVAPVSSGDLFHTRIQYWAAGVDCCEAMSNFDCFDRQHAAAGGHGALVLSKDSQNLEGYRRAVAGALGAYDLTAGDHYLLVKWHKDPVGYRQGLWTGTATLFAIFAAVYLAISAMIAIAVMPILVGSPQL